MQIRSGAKRRKGKIHSVLSTSPSFPCGIIPPSVAPPVLDDAPYNKLQVIRDTLRFDTLRIGQ